MKINVRVLLICLLTPLLLTNCSEAVSEGGAVHVKWALGSSLACLAPMPVVLFIAWCFYKIYIHRRISADGPGILRLFRVIRMYGLFFVLPVPLILGALEGFQTDYSISDQGVVFKDGAPAEFDWKDLQFMNDHPSNGYYLLDFEKDQVSRSLEVRVQLLGKDNAEKVRGWVDTAIKVHRIKSMQWR